MTTAAIARKLESLRSLTWSRGSSCPHGYRWTCCVLPAALVIVGCGGGMEPARSPEHDAPSETAEEPPEAPSGQSSPELDGAPSEERAAEEDAGDVSLSLLEQEFFDLERALEQGADCPSADHFRGRVCSLAERICRIAEEVPNSTSARADCQDARSRCEQANQRFADVCSNR